MSSFPQVVGRNPFLVRTSYFMSRVRCCFRNRPALAPDYRFFVMIAPMIDDFEGFRDANIAVSVSSDVRSAVAFDNIRDS